VKIAGVLPMVIDRALRHDRFVS